MGEERERKREGKDGERKKDIRTGHCTVVVLGCCCIWTREEREARKRGRRRKENKRGGGERRRKWGSRASGEREKGRRERGERKDGEMGFTGCMGLHIGAWVRRESERYTRER